MFFPSGHCMPVSLGGFLLQGGFGWNSRLWGPACCSILGMDIVTADGELVHANESENADLFWAARGAGPGFFGVVTRFHLALHPRPQAMMKSDYVYPIEVLDDVLRWIRTIQPSLPLNMEPLVFVRRDMFGHSGPMALVTAPVMADSQEEARAALALLETCPVLGKAVMREVEYRHRTRWAVTGSGRPALPARRALRCRQHVDQRIGRRPASRHAKNRRDDAAGALAYDVDAVGTDAAAPCHVVLDGVRSVYCPLRHLARCDRRSHKPSVGHRAHARTWRILLMASSSRTKTSKLGRSGFSQHPNFQRLQAIRSERDPNGMFHSYMALPLK